MKVNTTNAKGKHDLLDLKPFTDYEFQVSSKLHLYKGSWSDWSKSLRMQTPEEGMCQKKKKSRMEAGGGGAFGGEKGWRERRRCNDFLGIESLKSIIALINKLIFT